MSSFNCKVAGEIQRLFLFVKLNLSPLMQLFDTFVEAEQRKQKVNASR